MKPEPMTPEQISAEVRNCSLATEWDGIETYDPLEKFALAIEAARDAQWQEMLSKHEPANQMLLDAARGVISWTESTHRPPVRDEFESGRMVLVRLHALADLNAAIAAAEKEMK